MRLRLSLSAFLVLALALCVSWSLAAPAATDGLFTAANMPHSLRVSPCRSTIPFTSRAVTINLNQIQQATTLTLNLFDDVTYTAINTRIEPRPLGHPGYIWSGTLAGVESSTVTLVVNDQAGIMHGIIGVPGYRYAISAVGQAGIHEIVGYELTSDNIAYVPTDFSPAAPPQTRVDDGSQIDILVIYTPGAKSIMERVVGDVETAIDGAIAHTNQIFTNSGITTQLNLVHVQPMFYLEQPNVDFNADLNNLMGADDGYMDDVHALRDFYQADLVAMISGVWFASYTGIAPAPAPLDAAKGFSITEACHITDTTFAHQIGHNLGAGHDLANADQPPVEDDGYGYQDPSTGAGDYGDFVTVMALRTGGECPPIVTANKCSIIERFSNPNQTHNGKPIGSVNANAVRAINENAVIVANYRASSGNPPAQTNVLLNGSFEIDADQDLLPDFWRGKNLSAGDGIKCNQAAYIGSCALILSSKNSKLTQKLAGSGFNPGDLLTLSARVAGKKLTPGADLRLIVKYSDTTKEKLKLSVPDGTYAFTLLSDILVLDKPVQKVKIQVRHKNAAGKLTLDAVSLTRPASPLIPLPADN